MTPEDADMKAVQQLTLALKGELQKSMDESGINQLNKLYAMFNTTAEKLRQQKEKQHPHPGRRLQNHLWGYGSNRLHIQM